MATIYEINEDGSYEEVENYDEFGSPGAVEPVLKPGTSHDYVSGCPLTTSQGSMEGHYILRRDDGKEIQAAIPFFPLAAPATAG